MASGENGEKKVTPERLMAAFGDLLRNGCQVNEHLGVCYVIGLIGPLDPETHEQPFMFQSNANELSVVNKLMAKMLDEAALMEEDPRIIDPNTVTH